MDISYSSVIRCYVFNNGGIMSVLSFLKDILDLFIKKFPAFVSGLLNKIPKELRSQIVVVIKVVENLKTFVDSPASDFLTTIIPGEADDKLKEWLRKVLPGVLKALNVVEVTEDSVRLVLSEYEDARASQLGDIASLLTKELTGASIGQSRITTEVVYQSYKKNK